MKRNIRTWRRLANVLVVGALLLVLAQTAAAQGEQPEVNALDTVWVLVAAFLVFFMQAGFGFLEAGFVRSKHVVNIMAENFMDTTMSTLGFIFVGFGLMSVSYTHLDVYKRQPLVGCAWQTIPCQRMRCRSQT